MRDIIDKEDQRRGVGEISGHLWEQNKRKKVMIDFDAHAQRLRWIERVMVLGRSTTFDAYGGAAFS